MNTQKDSEKLKTLSFGVILKQTCTIKLTIESMADLNLSDGEPVYQLIP